MQFVKLEVGKLPRAGQRIEQPDVIVAEPDPAIEPFHIRAGDVENPAAGYLDCGVDRARASKDRVANEGRGLTEYEFVALLAA